LELFALVSGLGLLVNLVALVIVVKRYNDRKNGHTELKETNKPSGK